MGNKRNRELTGVRKKGEWGPPCLAASAWAWMPMSIRGLAYSQNIQVDATATPTRWAVAIEQKSEKAAKLSSVMDKSWFGDDD